MTLQSSGLRDVGLGAGVTTNFQVQYEDALYAALPSAQSAKVKANLIANANSLLAVVEANYAVTTGWFATAAGKFGSVNRQVININKSDGGGASNSGYGSAINVDGQGNNATNTAAPIVGMVWMNEWSEILMSLTPNWHSGDSSGEGLSQYTGLVLFQAGHYDYYGSWVNVWLNGNGTSPNAARSDWVNKTFTGSGAVHGDADAVSFGCALCFIYYLIVQLGFTINEVIAAYGSNLATAYKTLTGSQADPFPGFIGLLNSRFPTNVTASIPGPVTDNPYPLWARQFGIAVPASTHPATPLASLARFPAQEELFWIGAVGDVSSNWRNDNVAAGAWHSQFAIAGAGSVRGDSSLVALARMPSQEDVFWIGAVGDVSSNWRNDAADGGAWHKQFAIAASGSVRARSPLIAIARFPQSTDVFWIGAVSDVSSNWRNDKLDNGAWHNPFAIARAGSVRSDSPLVAFARFPQAMDVFWVGTVSDISSNWRNDGIDNGIWHQQFAIAQAGTVRAGSPIVAFARFPQSTDVFWIGADSDVSSNWRNDGLDEGAWHSQFAIARPGSVRADSPLVAYARFPQSTDVFWVGAVGDISSNWRNDGVDSGAWHSQFAIAPSGSVRAGSPLVALSRRPARQEVLWIATDGSVTMAWRDDNLFGGAWQPPKAINLPGSTRADSPLVAFARDSHILEVFWVGANGDVSSTFLG